MVFIQPFSIADAQALEHVRSHTNSTIDQPFVEHVATFWVELSPQLVTLDGSEYANIEGESGRVDISFFCDLGGCQRGVGEEGLEAGRLVLYSHS